MPRIPKAWIREAKASDAKDPVAIAADVGYDENCKIVIDEVVNYFGRIDILVNNAAEQHLNKFVEEITEDRLGRTLRTNMFFHFFMTRFGSSTVNILTKRILSPSVISVQLSS